VGFRVFRAIIPRKNPQWYDVVPVAPPGATMAISFQSDEEVLRKLRERLRKMSDEELIRFGKDVRRLAENPFRLAI
jgi:hypothetical protein